MRWGGGAQGAWSPPQAQALPPGPTSRLQELYYEIAHVLSLMLEDLPQKKRSQTSENSEET